MRSRSRRRRSGAAADHLDICVIPKLVTLQPFIQEGQLSHLGGRGGQTGGAEAARPSPSKPGKRDAAVKPIFSKEFSASARHSDRTACQRGNTSGVAAHHLRVLRCRSSPEYRPVNQSPTQQTRLGLGSSGSRSSPDGFWQPQ